MQMAQSSITNINTKPPQDINQFTDEMTPTSKAGPPREQPLPKWLKTKPYLFSA